MYVVLFFWYRRLDKPPSKELIRLFIRANSIRSGQNPTSPWVVDEDKVKEFSLPSKFNDFFLSPVKVISKEIIVDQVETRLGYPEDL